MPGYGLLNARSGSGGRRLDISIRARNLLNKDYYELLTAAPGNTSLAWDSQAIRGPPASPWTSLKSVARPVMLTTSGSTGTSDIDTHGIVGGYLRPAAFKP